MTARIETSTCKCGRPKKRNNMGEWVCRHCHNVRHKQWMIGQRATKIVMEPYVPGPAEQSEIDRDTEAAVSLEEARQARLETLVDPREQKRQQWAELAAQERRGARP
jgi:hypothetical protein